MVECEVDWGLQVAAKAAAESGCTGWADEEKEKLGWGEVGAEAGGGSAVQ